MKKIIVLLIIPIIESALYEIQQRRKKQAYAAGLKGLEVTMFMLLACPDKEPQADAQAQQLDSLVD